MTEKNLPGAGCHAHGIRLYENNLVENLLALMRQLKDGTFRPLPLRRVWIPKGDGRTRPLGIPRSGIALLKRCSGCF